MPAAKPAYDKLIFELSSPGRFAYSLPESDVPDSDPAALLPKEHLRASAAELPEVSEVDVIRHYSRLSQMNYGVDTHFYPLGSCTMKYNPKINEDMARLGGFARLHPLAPEAASQGALQLMWELARDLAEISGMDEVSLQPAAGAQGELAGVLMIRAYHLARGERRHKVLIPDSAHGTNPASTALAGFSVVELKSEANGDVDLVDLERHLDEDVAAFMITQPNTLGLFESQDPPDHRDVPRQGRAGLHGRRQLQRHPRHHAPRRPGLRRLPLQPAQDLHHAARRRRARLGAGGHQGASGAVPAHARGGEATRTATRSTGTARSPSASCRPSGATSACWCGPTPTSAPWARTGCARSPRTRCSTPTTS